MFKKKKINITIDLLFIMYILFAIGFNFITTLIGSNDSITFGEISLNGSMEMFFNLAILLAIAIFFTIITNFIVIIGYVGIRLGIKAYIKDKLDDNDFGKNKDYYRNILELNSPGELSYIDNFEIKNDRVLVSTLLYLRLKKYITMDNNNIEVIRTDFEKLDSNEIYVIENLNNLNKLFFREKIIADALRDGLLETNQDFKKKLIKKIVKLFLIFASVSILLGFSIYLVSSSIETNESLALIIVFLLLIPLFLITFFFPMFSFIYIISYGVFNKMSPYIRTKKGIEINKMLEGLKNYFRDFSVIDTRKKEEIVIWEEYLIYSILFGLNDDIVTDIINTYKLNV